MKRFACIGLSLMALALSGCSAKPEPDEAPQPSKPITQKQPLSHILFFDFDNDEPLAGARDVIQRHADYLVRFPSRRVLIEGTADERGDREYNYHLGLRRANRIRDMLIDAGVDESQLMVRSIGIERPLNAQGKHERNRRVVLIY